MALTGRSGLPVLNARTSNEFQPKTRSIGVRLFSPQSSWIFGAPSPASIETSASAARTELVSVLGRHSGTLICPRSSVMAASAIAELQIEVHRAARAAEDARPAMVEPRAVRADQRIGLERRLVGFAE